MAEKKPVTNFKTVLDDIRYHQLIKGSDLWQSKVYQTNAETMRKRAKTIGDGLEAFYHAFTLEGMKRDDKAKRIEEYFPLMDVKERSDFRNYAKWFPQIETWTMANYPKGYNIHNIVMGFNTFKNKEYKPIAQMFNEAYSEGHDLLGNPSNVDYDPDQDTFVSKDIEYLKTFENKSKKKPVVMANVKKKEGVVVITTKVTIKDFDGIVNKFFANINNLFDNEKFTGDTEVKVLKNYYDQSIEFNKKIKLTMDMNVKNIKKVA